MTRTAKLRVRAFDQPNDSPRPTVGRGSEERTMTMVHKLRSRTRPVRVVCSMAVLVWASITTLVGAAPPVHYQHAGIMPPGAIGKQQLLRGGPLPGYFQPVEITGPDGTLIAMAVDGQFDEPRSGPIVAGLLIGSVYRLRVTNIPLQEGLEVYPTIELIDRIYPPIGQEFKFPIPIALAKEELEMALAGKFVTRVVYLENPDIAEPVAREGNEQSYFEVPKGENPLDVADGLGRPVAILRLGGRVPGPAGPDETFLYGSPPMVKWTRCKPQTTGVAAKVPPIARKVQTAGALVPLGQPSRRTAAP
jgi:hypothetical protein